MLPVSVKIGQGALNMLLKRAGYYCMNPIAGNQKKELPKKIHRSLQII
jgi:hypothetical protein